MGSLFEERFELLVDSGQANAASIAATRIALALVERRFDHRLDEETGAPLATHLAITLKRLLENETLSAVPETVWAELQAHPQELDLAAAIVKELERNLQRSISRDEQGFIAVHLCVIQEKISATSTSPTHEGSQ